jgi:hypothetical protein
MLITHLPSVLLTDRQFLMQYELAFYNLEYLLLRGVFWQTCLLSPFYLFMPD